MNLADIVILLIVAAAVFCAVRRVKKNKGGCSCGCANCEQSCSAKRKENRGAGTETP